MRKTWTLGQRYVALTLARMFFATSLTAFIISFMSTVTACPTRNQKDGLKRSKTAVPKPRGTASTAGVECFKCGENGHYGEGEWCSRHVWAVRHPVLILASSDCPDRWVSVGDNRGSSRKASFSRGSGSTRGASRGRGKGGKRGAAKSRSTGKTSVFRAADRAADD